MHLTSQQQEALHSVGGLHPPHFSERQTTKFECTPDNSVPVQQKLDSRPVPGQSTGKMVQGAEVRPSGPAPTHLGSCRSSPRSDHQDAPGHFLHFAVVNDKGFRVVAGVSDEPPKQHQRISKRGYSPCRSKF